MSDSLQTQTLQFIRQGHTVSLTNVPPTRTLLEVLREDLGCTGTKEGCGEGDCGACTVVLAAAQGDRLSYTAINSCIRLAHSVHGMALWTVEDLAPPGGPLHPAQESLVRCHGSQCGFCTPGFVMSLFGMYQNRVLQGQTITREDAQADLSGNLCRCTGYRPILDAAQQMGDLPRVTVNDADLLQKLKQINTTSCGHAPQMAENSGYLAPRSLSELLQARAQHLDAQLVAGCTDVGLWVTKQHRQFAQVLDVTRVAELRTLTTTGSHLQIGAAVTLTEAFAALVADRPQLARFAQRFAGLPVRNSGTLGGNVANGSPIGDSMPLLIALGAEVELASTRGHRRLPLEQLYTGYRQNVMAPDEVLAHIHVPRPSPRELLRVYKISKRQDDDISAVCLAVRLELDGAQVLTASVGAGGVAATPVRARATEAALAGQAWTEATVQQAQQVLAQEFSPISDMRASAAYRRAVLGRLLQRLWLETCSGQEGAPPAHLDALVLEDLA